MTGSAAEPSSVGAVGPVRRVLRRLIPQTHSVLLLPVSLPPGLLPAPRPSLFGAAIPHHVTILYPFVANASLDGAVVAAVERVVLQHRAFRFRLPSIDRFPNVTYLTVDPQEPFLELIGAFQRAWPEHPRYGGEFSSVVPHVTIAERPHPVGIEARVAARLPVEGVADRVEIWCRGLVRGWRRHAGFQLPPAT